MKVRELEEMYNTAIVKYCSLGQITDILTDVKLKIAMAQRKSKKARKENGTTNDR